MQSLLDPAGSYLVTEKKVKKYIKSIPDDKLKIFYENIELTPFPILIAKEFHKRFFENRNKTKKKTPSKKTPKKTKSYSKLDKKRKRPTRSKKLALRYTQQSKIAKKKGR